MLLVMKSNATAENVEAVVQHVEGLGLTAHPIPGAARTAIGITGNAGALASELFAGLPGVAQAIPVSKPFKLVSRQVKQEDTIIDIDGVKVGGEELVIMAGPCSVENHEQLMSAADAAQAAGAKLLRGGAFKPRTSPYSFQGLKEEGLKLLAEARLRTGLKIITEVISPDTVDLVAEYADVLQIGARNMQNFALLEKVGKLRKPVLLKRGMSATIQELLMAAEYLLSGGNYNVMLCERGIRTFETMTRNTFDIGAVIVLKELTHLPVIVDPSHGIGIRQHVPALTRAGIVAGADGAIIEMHPDPDKAMSDGAQSLTPKMLAALMHDLRRYAPLLGRTI